MSKKKLAGIIIGCTVAIIAVIVIVIPRLTPTPGSTRTISGTYVCTQGGDILEFEQDGTAYMTDSDSDFPPYVGRWEIEGDKIVLTFEIGGTTHAYRGRIEGNTITLEGSNCVCVKEAS